MSTTTDTRTHPSAWWYALPAVLVIGGILASILLFVSAFDRFSDVARSVSSGTVDVQDDQLSIFASGLPGQGGPSGLERCTLTPTAGGAPVTTERSSIDLSYSAGDQDWERIGVVPDGTTPGTYELDCPGYSSAQLRVATTDGIKAGVIFAVAGVIVPVGALVLALALLVVIIVLRARSKDRNRVAAAPAHAGGYPAPPPYAQQPPYGSQPSYGTQPPPYGQQPPYAGQPPQPPRDDQPPYGEPPTR